MHSRRRKPSPLHSPEHGRLGTVLHDLRLRAGLSQRELADRLDQHVNYVWRTEQQARRIDIFEFARWCRECDADPAEVFRLVTRDSGRAS